MVCGRGPSIGSKLKQSGQDALDDVKGVVSATPLGDELIAEIGRGHDRFESEVEEKVTPYLGTILSVVGGIFFGPAGAAVGAAIGTAANGGDEGDIWRAAASAGVGSALTGGARGGSAGGASADASTSTVLTGAAKGAATGAATNAAVAAATGANSDQIMQSAVQGAIGGGAGGATGALNGSATSGAGTTGVQAVTENAGAWDWFEWDWEAAAQGALTGAATAAATGGNSEDILRGAGAGGVASGTSGQDSTFFDDIREAWGSTADFLAAPVATIKGWLPSLGELGDEAVEKFKAELGRLPENIANGVLGAVKGGGEAAAGVLDAMRGGGDTGGLLDRLGAIYTSERASDSQAEAIRYATDARLEASRESMALQRELAEQGFDFQDRGLRLGGPWREAGMGALNELNQLQGLGPLSNAVDPYTGKPVEGAGGALSREDAQTAARGRFKASPGYQFRLDEGSKAVDRLASARGYVGSTRAAREIQRYGDNLASNEYGNYVGQLQTLASGGSQQVASGVGALGGSANQAHNLGTNLATSAQNAGDIRATGYITEGTYGASNWRDRGNLWQELI